MTKGSLQYLFFNIFNKNTNICILFSLLIVKKQYNYFFFFFPLLINLLKTLTINLTTQLSEFHPTAISQVTIHRNKLYIVGEENIHAFYAFLIQILPPLFILNLLTTSHLQMKSDHYSMKSQVKDIAFLLAKYIE